VCQIVRSAFETAGLPNYGPHAFRHMLARHAAKHCKSVAELVATSQNLGHTDVLTTLRSLGQIDRARQRTLITGPSDEDIVEGPKPAKATGAQRGYKCGNYPSVSRNYR